MLCMLLSQPVILSLKVIVFKWVEINLNEIENARIQNPFVSLNWYPELPFYIIIILFLKWVFGSQKWGFLRWKNIDQQLSDKIFRHPATLCIGTVLFY